MSVPPSSADVSRLSTLTAGIVLAAFALALGVLVIGLGWRAVTGGLKVSLIGMLLSLVLALVTLGLGTLSWRFIANRPNRYQSIFGPMGWKICAAFWFAAAAGVAFTAAQERTAQPIGGAIGALALAVGSWRRSSSVAAKAPARPSNKSLERSRER